MSPDPGPPALVLRATTEQSDACFKTRKPDTSTSCALHEEDTRCGWCLEACVRTLRQRPTGVLHLTAADRETRCGLSPAPRTPERAQLTGLFGNLRRLSSAAYSGLHGVSRGTVPRGPQWCCRFARGFTPTNELTVPLLAGAEPLPVPLGPDLCKTVASEQLRKRSRRLSYSIAIPSECFVEVRHTRRRKVAVTCGPQQSLPEEHICLSANAVWQCAQPHCERLTPTTIARTSSRNLEDELTAAGMTDGGAIRVRKLSYVEPVSHLHTSRSAASTAGTVYGRRAPLLALQPSQAASCAAAGCTRRRT